MRVSEQQTMEIKINLKTVIHFKLKSVVTNLDHRYLTSDMLMNIHWRAKYYEIRSIIYNLSTLNND